MARYRCNVCDYVYDEAVEGVMWADLPDNWVCPVCDSPKSLFRVITETSDSPDEHSLADQTGSVPNKYRRSGDDLEVTMADIHRMAETGHRITEPMRTLKPVISWDDILVKGAQLARLPLNEDEPVNTRTVIGPGAAHPLVIETPVYISHMSFGALSREVKMALAKGSAAARTAMCSGEGGILPESLANAYKYIFEYIPNRYSVTDENLRKVDAVEIKFGQSVKPGMGGHLPGAKVTKEIAAVRGFAEGVDITSPARYPDIRDGAQLRQKIDWLREKTGGKPIGVKLAAGNIEADLAIALEGSPDYVTIDGRPGGTGSAPRYIKAATSVPTLFALYRARKFLDEAGARHVTLVITGGLRVSSDFAKAIALGADAVAIASAALMACGCQQYRVCNTGKCPVGITTQDPELRSRFNIERGAQQIENYLRVCTDELCDFARLTGNDDLHKLSIEDLCTTNSEISDHTTIEHV
jgi:methylamine---glutamate N-methyltransferase subunit C